MYLSTVRYGRQLEENPDQQPIKGEEMDLGCTVMKCQPPAGANDHRAHRIGTLSTDRGWLAISHSSASFPLGRYERGSCDSSCFFSSPLILLY